jgi:superfamily II DNA/RNA helicase
VEQITHVINYDLPEIAENFIHRVGRTGRAGELGIASTLFSRDQRTELFQLERTLGIRIEKMPVDAAWLVPKETARPSIVQSAKASKRGMVQLPGEYLQVLMET